MEGRDPGSQMDHPQQQDDESPNSSIQNLHHRPWFSWNTSSCCFAGCQSDVSEHQGASIIWILNRLLVIMDILSIWSFFIYISLQSTEFEWKQLDWPLWSSVRCLVYFMTADKAMRTKEFPLSVPFAVFYYFIYGTCLAYGIFRLGLSQCTQKSDCLFIMANIVYCLVQVLLVYIGVYSLPSRIPDCKDPEEIQPLLQEDIQVSDQPTDIDAVMRLSISVNEPDTLSIGVHVPDSTSSPLLQTIPQADSSLESSTNCVFPVLNRTDNISSTCSQTSSHLTSPDYMILETGETRPLSSSEQAAMTILQQVMKLVWKWDWNRVETSASSLPTITLWDTHLTSAEYLLNSLKEEYVFAAEIMRAELLVMRFILTRTSGDHAAIEECLRPLEQALKSKIDEFPSLPFDADIPHGLGSTSCRDDGMLKYAEYELTVLLVQSVMMRGLDQIVYQGRDIKGGLKAWSILQKLMVDTCFPFIDPTTTPAKSPHRKNTFIHKIPLFSPFDIKQRVQEGIIYCLALFQLSLEWYPRLLSPVLKPLGIKSNRDRIELLKHVALGRGIRAPAASFLLVSRLGRLCNKTLFTSHMISMTVPLVSHTSLVQHQQVWVNGKYKSDVEDVIEWMTHVTKGFTCVTSLSVFHHYALSSVYRCFGLYHQATVHLDTVFQEWQLDGLCHTDPSTFSHLPLVLLYDKCLLYVIQTHWSQAYAWLSFSWQWICMTRLQGRVDVGYHIGCLYMGLFKLGLYTENITVFQAQVHQLTSTSHTIHKKSDVGTLLVHVAQDKWTLGAECIYVILYFCQQWTGISQCKDILDKHANLLQEQCGTSQDPWVLLLLGSLKKLQFISMKRDGVNLGIKQVGEAAVSLLEQSIHSSNRMNHFTSQACASHASYELAQVMAILGNRATETRLAKQAEIKVVVGYRDLSVWYLKQCMRLGCIKHFTRQQQTSPSEPSASDVPGILKISSPSLPNHPRLCSPITPLSSTSPELEKTRVGSLSSSMTGSFSSSLGSSVLFQHQSTQANDASEKQKNRKYGRFLFYDTWKCACLVLLDDLLHHE